MGHYFWVAPVFTSIWFIKLTWGFTPTVYAFSFKAFWGPDFNQGDPQPDLLGYVWGHFFFVTSGLDVVEHLSLGQGPPVFGQIRQDGFSVLPREADQIS